MTDITDLLSFLKLYDINYSITPKIVKIQETFCIYEFKHYFGYAYKLKSQMNINNFNYLYSENFICKILLGDTLFFLCILFILFYFYGFMMLGITMLWGKIQKIQLY